MADSAQTPRLAVLFDAENISSTVVSPLLTRLKTHRFVTLKRAYGDWGHLQGSGWRNVLLDYGIQAVHAPNYSVGKNSADILLTIDAMDLLHQQVRWFCIVTNDSDFTPLVQRLIGGGARVVGFGTRRASESFMNACHRFIVLEESEYLSKSAQKAVFIASLQRKPIVELSETPERAAARRQLATALQEIFCEFSPKNNWVRLKDFHGRIQKRQPDFSCRQFGQKGMVKLMESLDVFELRKVKNPTAPSQIMIEMRLKPPE
jgi:uncharacterized LabA/DUF88 family protein